MGLPSYVPPTWTFECNEDLIRFLYNHLDHFLENLGKIEQYVESIDVSSCAVGALENPPQPGSPSSY